MEELTRRIQALEDKFADMVVLTPWQIRIIQWTANAVGGLATVIGVLFAVSTVAKAVKDLEAFLP